MIQADVVEPEIARKMEVEGRVLPQAAGRYDSLDLLLLLGGRLRLLASVTLAFLVAGIVVAFALRPTYSSTAIILPPQQLQSSLTAMLGQIGSLASLTGGSSLGLKSPADMYIGFLKSRTIGDSIIEEFNLSAVYHRKKMEDLRKDLAKHTVIDAGKDGLIHITVMDHDATRASEMANAYVTELYKMNSKVAVSEARQRRVFFDRQLAEEKSALSAAEDNLRLTQQKTGIIQLSGQAEVVIRSVAEMRAEISSREVELQSLLSYATNQNPDVTRLQQEIATMRGQLAKLENDQQRQATPGNITVPAGSVPAEALEYARNLRDLKYHEVLYELLARQLEAARIDEAKSAPIVQVIDRAVPPDKQSGPPRVLLTVGSGMLGFVLACSWVFLQGSYDRLLADPEVAQKADRLRRMIYRRV